MSIKAEFPFPGKPGTPFEAFRVFFVGPGLRRPAEKLAKGQQPQPGLAWKPGRRDESRVEFLAEGVPPTGSPPGADARLGGDPGQPLGVF